MQWFKDGEVLNPLTTENSQLYAVTSSGEMRIKMLTNETAGYYVCITTFHSGLGSYRTVDRNIEIDVPGES